MVDPHVTWFLDQCKRGTVTPFRDGIDVDFYIEYVDYYAAAGASIARARSGALILLAGWSLERETPVGQPTTPIGDLLASQGGNRCQVRVLVSGHFGAPNGPIVAWLNNQSGCAAVADDRLRLPGTFHQKALFVEEPDGPVAFVGGMDFGRDRLRQPDRPPWHDVQVRVTGLAAIDVRDVLADRWETLAVNSAYAHRQITRAPAPQPTSTQRRSVQAVRTYGNPTTTRILASTVLRPPSALPPAALGPSFAGGSGYPTEYRFSPRGDSSFHDLLVKAIRATESYIYVEDQYFVASSEVAGRRELIQELARTIGKPSFKHLLVLTTGVGTVQDELYQTNQRRRDLWNVLAGAYPDRVSVWAYKGGQDRVYWMHSKAWFFDDAFAIVGSANFNRRGLCHDGELGVGILDLYAPEALPVPHEMRVRLWQKHLPTPKRPVSRDQITDFEAGLNLWVDTPDTYLTRLDLSQGDAAHPDKLAICNPAVPGRAGWAGMIEAITCKVEQYVAKDVASKMDLQWDLIVDPDGS